MTPASPTRPGSAQLCSDRGNDAEPGRTVGSVVRSYDSPKRRVESDFAKRSHNRVDGNNTLTWLWVHNFADGLAIGEYELVGTWYVRCRDYFTDCTDKNARRVLKTETLILTILDSQPYPEHRS